MYVFTYEEGRYVCIAIDWIFQYHTKKAPHSRSNYSRDPTSYLAEKSFYVERQKSSFDCMHQWTDFAGFLQNFFLLCRRSRPQPNLTQSRRDLRSEDFARYAQKKG